ncbi:MAG TPA: ABC transporter permease [Clostridia bacterium]|jgi:peptide/nickel transport system permease protein|nr:MAG: putative D,D-dipeptide transport system permease protein DdpB [Firmicutes bacterium ADurb.Bin248]HOG01069.1 ABC transporter permease [Clostridia bacterium]HOS18965.1 ABC transporter permease [Clostridia bacterium]HPK14943.1 ABC transporter permease [Clostridia bacterium]
MILKILKRVVSYLLVLLGLSVFVFILVRVMPGDTARLALGPRAPEETVQALRREMHLDKSIPVQYYYWLKGILQGDLGTSVISKRPITEDIAFYLPATVELALLSAIFMATFGILLGVTATKYSEKWPDAIIRVLSYLGIVAPAFLWAVLAMLLFAYLIPILPVSGRISAGIAPPVTRTGLYIVDYLLQGNFAGAWDAFRHLVMPAIVLSFGGISQSARICRASMVSNMEKPYAAAERAYGIPENKILYKYLLKPSLNSFISVTALDIAMLFGGAYLVESIFNYPGLSRYGLTAMLNKDVFAVSAVMLVDGVIVIGFNLVTDIIISFLDPRIRYSSST